MSCYDWTKGGLLVRGGGGDESFKLVPARKWGRGRTLSLEEAES